MTAETKAACLVMCLSDILNICLQECFTLNTFNSSNYLCGENIIAAHTRLVQWL